MSDQAMAMPDKKDYLQKLAQSIIDSYEIRVHTVHSLMTQATHFLHCFQEELDEMIGRVRENLAISQSLRHKDFDAMIQDILDRHRQIGRKAEQHLAGFEEQESRMISVLRSIIVNGSRSNVHDMEVLLADIRERQKERELDIIRILRQTQIEQEELKSGLKRLLEKGEDIRVKDLKIMLKAVRAQQHDVNREMFAFLDDFDLVRNRVAGQWQNVADAAG